MRWRLRQSSSNTAKEQLRDLTTIWGTARKKENQQNRNGDQPETQTWCSGCADFFLGACLSREPISAHTPSFQMYTRRADPFPWPPFISHILLFGVLSLRNLQADLDLWLFSRSYSTHQYELILSSSARQNARETLCDMTKKKSLGNSFGCKWFLFNLLSCLLALVSPNICLSHAMQIRHLRLIWKL